MAEYMQPQKGSTCAHTYTHTHTPAYTHTHTHTHTQTSTERQTHTHTDTHTYKQTHTQTQTQTDMRTQADRDTRRLNKIKEKIKIPIAKSCLTKTNNVIILRSSSFIVNLLLNSFDNSFYEILSLGTMIKSKKSKCRDWRTFDKTQNLTD